MGTTTGKIKYMKSLIKNIFETFSYSFFLKKTELLKLNELKENELRY